MDYLPVSVPVTITSFVVLGTLSVLVVNFTASVRVISESPGLSMSELAIWLLLRSHLDYVCMADDPEVYDEKRVCQDLFKNGKGLHNFLFAEGNAQCQHGGLWWSMLCAD